MPATFILAPLLALLLASALMAVDGSGNAPALIPLPAHLELKPGSFLIGPGTAMAAPEALRDTVELCAGQLRSASGFALPLRSDGAIAFEQDAALAHLTDEGYTLAVTPERVLIRAAHRRGLFYGFQTFRQLLPAKAYAVSPVAGDDAPWSARCLAIEDRPRFPWRAMMLDCARTFHDAAYIRRYIDALAVHKVNILHWHLTDDEGWRIEIRGLPELTRAGAWSGAGAALAIPGCRSRWFPADDRHGGFYTQEEIRGIVAYARARGVDILPEIDVPGHSRAVAAAYPGILCSGATGSPPVPGHQANVWCASRPENAVMMTTIFTEVAALFPFAYIHIGGDEVDHRHWKGCPACNALARQEGLPDGSHLQRLVTLRLEALCAKLGRKLVGWNEIMGKGISRDTCIMSWTGVEPGYAAAAAGHPVVMAPGPFTYFDMAQGPGERGHWWAGMVTLERCYSFDPLLSSALSPDQLGNILGVEACLWTEFCLPHPATQERLGLSDEELLRRGSGDVPAPSGFTDYQTHPRLAALAETGWTPQELRCYPDFARRLGQGHLARLGRLGLHYRVPTPSAQLSAGQVTVLPPWAGAEVRYTLDGTAPSARSERYTRPFGVSESGRLRLVTVAPDGRLSLAVSGAERAPAAAWEPGSFTGTPQRVSFPLQDAIARPGNWSVELRQRAGSARLEVSAARLLLDGTPVAEDRHPCSLDMVHADGGGANAYRLPLKEVPAGARIALEIEAATVHGPDSAGTMRLALSPWYEPDVSVSCDLPIHDGHAAALAGDWNRSSFFWASRGARRGETMTWSFPQAVPPAEICVPTGKPGGNAQDHLDRGTLLVSYDGQAFEPLAAFSSGLARAVIERPFKALRLRADADMDTWLAVQDPQLTLRGLAPACQVATTLPHYADKFPALAADWKRDTWFWSSRAPKPGDTFTWTFDAPVACATVEVRTGDPAKPERDQLRTGVLEASGDGATWTLLGAFAGGQAAGTVTHPLKALRLRVTEDQPQSWLIIQDPVLR